MIKDILADKKFIKTMIEVDKNNGADLESAYQFLKNKFDRLERYEQLKKKLQELNNAKKPENQEDPYGLFEEDDLDLSDFLEELENQDK
ncbi:hypothetical protein [Mesomycoplasma hyopneumoniae]|uniref:hypothetical protein n=1 Tax=Mesomycoplasma hyopneumoniae TaxID=2099 RepID=UPI0015CD156F|nr:hypothetical protein [Mesomycoplasma hyopneumoniae]NYN91733.1 hypothetical protein [Mesomycoplasma hyopneumoniae]